MFELPEYTVLAKQINKTLVGKTIKCGNLGNSPHKFVWYNRKHDEFTQLTCGKGIGRARVQGRWLIIPLEPGYNLVLGECGGKALYHPVGTELPAKYHLWLEFEDGSFFTVTTQMWGAMELYEAGKEQERQYIKSMRTTPVEPGFTFAYFSSLIDELLKGENRSTKSLLTQDQLIPGLGNASAQDILFHAHLLPRRSLSELSLGQRRDLYEAIVHTIREIIDQGGRNDETDLFGERGGYIRIMDSAAAGKPCPECGTKIQKIQYLGGACYFCPKCQV
ncbi:MAG TPA: DNA-formamidopyrimidine glycosylase family protein [Anaerolineales bacterium]|nr:DNA-formamidopyrimidine glycosylase family protein [Anaerolineales bacterium]